MGFIYITEVSINLIDTYNFLTLKKLCKINVQIEVFRRIFWALKSIEHSAVNIRRKSRSNTVSFDGFASVHKFITRRRELAAHLPRICMYLIKHGFMSKFESLH